LATYTLPGSNNYPSTEVVGESWREKQIAAAIGGRPRLDKEVEMTLPAVLVPEPDNPYDPNAISVRVRGHVVGYLSKEDAVRYRDPIHRIVASGHEATTTARIWAVVRNSYENQGPARFFSSVRVALSEPHLLVPSNGRPMSAHSVLPWGGAVQVLGEEDHFDVLFNHVPKEGHGLAIVTLHKDVQKLKNGTEKPYLEVRMDGERIGQLSPTTSAHFLPVVNHLEESGLHPAAWATVKGSSLAAQVTVQAAKATEVSDEWLHGSPAEFPALVAEAAHYSVPPAYVPEAETKRDSNSSTPANVSPTNASGAKQGGSGCLGLVALIPGLLTMALIRRVAPGSRNKGTGK
jgi:hypothetical protein